MHLWRSFKFPKSTLDAVLVGAAVLLPVLSLSCSSLSRRDLTSVRPGMDKAEVLDQVGNPKYTFRSSGQDHWVYVYYESDHELHSQVDFVDGKVVRVGHSSGGDTARAKVHRELDSAETLEEFESKARELRDLKKNSPDGANKIDKE